MEEPPIHCCNLLEEYLKKFQNQWKETTNLSFTILPGIVSLQFSLVVKTAVIFLLGVIGGHRVKAEEIQYRQILDRIHSLSTLYVCSRYVLFLS